MTRSDIKLTKAQIEHINQTGSMPCPHCETVMERFPRDPKTQVHAAKKPELYCAKDHESVALFVR